MHATQKSDDVVVSVIQARGDPKGHLPYGQNHPADDQHGLAARQLPYPPQYQAYDQQQQGAFDAEHEHHGQGHQQPAAAPQADRNQTDYRQEISEAGRRNDRAADWNDVSDELRVEPPLMFMKAAVKCRTISAGT